MLVAGIGGPEQEQEHDKPDDDPKNPGDRRVICLPLKNSLVKRHCLILRRPHHLVTFASFRAAGRPCARSIELHLAAFANRMAKVTAAAPAASRYRQWPSTKIHPPGRLSQWPGTHTAALKGRST